MFLILEHYQMGKSKKRAFSRLFIGLKPYRSDGELLMLTKLFEMELKLLPFDSCKNYLCCSEFKIMSIG